MEIFSVVIQRVKSKLSRICVSVVISGVIKIQTIRNIFRSDFRSKNPTPCFWIFSVVIPFGCRFWVIWSKIASKTWDFRTVAQNSILKQSGQKSSEQHGKSKVQKPVENQWLGDLFCGSSGGFQKSVAKPPYIRPSSKSRKTRLIFKCPKRGASHALQGPKNRAHFAFTVVFWPIFFSPAAPPEQKFSCTLKQVLSLPK